jgi:cell division protein FtsI (penicillin-binding protein 3)
MLALKAGAERQRAFLERLGLTEAGVSELGPHAAPQLPERWGQVETITVSYGHGLAMAPAQFAAAATALVNGGLKVPLTFLKHPLGGLGPQATRVVSAATSARLGEMMRRNVTVPSGTGRRAEVPGYEVGGKTGTAEMPGRGGYRKNAVIASFFAAFPSAAPRYTLLVMLFEPQRSEVTKGQITAGTNAAPLAARLIADIAPLLDVPMRRVAGGFDAGKQPK